MPYQEFSTGTQIDPAQLVKLQSLARLLPLHRQKKVLNEQSGNHSSTRRGRGIDFSEVREYQPGDDIRAMDWRVTARTGTAHIKVFREERERPVMIVCDLRASMYFGTRRALKSVVAADIAALFAWSAMANGDRVGGLLFNDEIEKDLRPHSGRKPLMAFLHQLGNIPTASSEPKQKQERMLEICRHMSRVIKPGTAVYMISDWQGFDEECEKALYKISRHSDLMAIQISDPFESQLPVGQFSLTDGKRKLPLKVSKAAQQAHQQAWAEQQEQLKQRLLRLRAPLASVSTALDPLDQLRVGLGFRSETDDVASPLGIKGQPA